MQTHDKFRADYWGPNKEKVLFDPVADLIVTFSLYFRELAFSIHAVEIDNSGQCLFST